MVTVTRGVSPAIDKKHGSELVLAESYGHLKSLLLSSLDVKVHNHAFQGHNFSLKGLSHKVEDRTGHGQQEIWGNLAKYSNITPVGQVRSSIVLLFKGKLGFSEIESFGITAIGPSILYTKGPQTYNFEGLGIGSWMGRYIGIQVTGLEGLLRLSSGQYDESLVGLLSLGVERYIEELAKVAEFLKE